MRLALLALLLAPPLAAATPLAVADAAGPVTLLVEAAATVRVAPADGRAARLSWHPPSGAARVVDVPREGAPLALDAGAHRLAAAPGRMVLVTPEAGAGVAVAGAPSLEAGGGGAGALAAACLAACSTNVKRVQWKRRLTHPEGRAS